MSGILNTWAKQGSFDRTDKSTHVVNLWYVPGGTEYSSAELVNVFFDSLEEATVFKDRYDTPSEMPHLSTIEEFDKISRDLNKEKAGDLRH